MPCALIVLGCFIAFAGCGDAGTINNGANKNVASSEPAEPELDVTIDRPGEFAELRKSKVRVHGAVQPAGAGVKVNGRSAIVQPDGTWSKVVHLDVGENPISVSAALAGSTDRVNDDLTVTRRRTAAERAAFRAAQERKRQERLATLRASAQAIDTELLQKNPDKHTGETVAVTGEIFQIQEGGDNFLLMNTGCETEYDIRICDGPTVHVTYDGETRFTEDDLLTVYGTVNGGLDYDTAIGGSNFVASIDGEILE
jgi:hypothetical protein